MRLILMRHGETIWNAEQRLQGHENAPLSARGVEQARSFRRVVEDLAPRRVVSSDLGRCRETLELIGFEGAPLDPRLRELRMGEWSGRRKPDLIADHPEKYWAWRAGTYHPEGGESWHEFENRVVAGLRDWLERSDGDLLAVVHSGVIRAALYAFLGLPQDRIVPVTPGTATLLSFENASSDMVRLEGYNIGLFAPQTADAVSD